jgi:Caspase domain
MIKRSLICSFVLLLLASFTSPAHAEKRVALVVGNSAYQNVGRLDNPTNDASLMADTLRDLGFTLVGSGARLDLDKAALDGAVQSFGQKIQGADVALFYYAGHGVQVRGSPQRTRQGNLSGAPAGPGDSRHAGLRAAGGSAMVRGGTWSLKVSSMAADRAS